MSHSKRSQHIALPAMRKWFALRPLAVSMSVVFLSACGEEPEVANIYTSVDECSSSNPNYMQECKVAYQEAKDEALRTGPKFLAQVIVNMNLAKITANMSRIKKTLKIYPTITATQTRNLAQVAFLCP